MNIKSEEKIKAAQNLALAIRTSKFSGKFYWDLWQLSDPNKPCNKAVNYLTSQQKVVLAHNVASLRHDCQSEKEFTSIYKCCYFLERKRFGAELFSELRKNSVPITQQVSFETWKQVHAKVKARLIELGLTTFQDAMRQKQQKLKKEEQLKKSVFFSKIGDKLSESMIKIKKLPQNLFAKIKSALTNEDTQNQNKELSAIQSSECFDKDKQKFK